MSVLKLSKDVIIHCCCVLLRWKQCVGDGRERKVSISQWSTHYYTRLFAANHNDRNNTTMSSNLYDENAFTADGLQMLTNSLCYTWVFPLNHIAYIYAAFFSNDSSHFQVCQMYSLGVPRSVHTTTNGRQIYFSHIESHDDTTHSLPYYLRLLNFVWFAAQRIRGFQRARMKARRKSELPHSFNFNCVNHLFIFWFPSLKNISGCFGVESFAKECDMMIIYDCYTIFSSCHCSHDNICVLILLQTIKSALVLFC